MDSDAGNGALPATPGVVNGDVQPITDGKLDIATQISGEAMMVEADGRIPFQKVQLWVNKNNKKPSNEAYDPKKDGPDVCDPGTILPGEAELIPDDNTATFLEVGIVMGQDPEKYLAKGKTRDKKRTHDRQKRGNLRRDAKALRAFIQVQDGIPAQSKFFVGCRATDGRLFTRTIKSTVIFFYPEFWKGINEAQLVKRQKAICDSCKSHCAVNKVTKARSILPRTPYEGLASLSDFVSTRVSDLATTHILQFEMWFKTRDKTFLHAMIKDIEREQFTRNGVLASNEGVRAFMDLEEPLSDENCVKLINELKLARPARVPYIPSLVKQVHEVLRQPHNDSKKPEKHQDTVRIGEYLSYPAVGFLLDCCHQKINLEQGPHVIRENVIDLVETSRIYVLNLGPCRDVSDEGLSVARPSTIALYRAIFERLESIRDKIQEETDIIAHSYGGLYEVSSIQELTMKMARSSDLDDSRSIWEQISRLQHEYVAGVWNDALGKHLDSLVQLLKEIVLHAENIGTD